MVERVFRSISHKIVLVKQIFFRMVVTSYRKYGKDNTTSTIGPEGYG